MLHLMLIKFNHIKGCFEKGYNNNYIFRTDSGCLMLNNSIYLNIL